MQGGSLGDKIMICVVLLLLVMGFSWFSLPIARVLPHPSWCGVLSTLNTSTKHVSNNGGRPVTLVTGGLGFIGSHVVEELLARKHTVIIYDDESNGHNFNPGATYTHGDIQVVGDFRQLERIDVEV